MPPSYAVTEEVILSNLSVDGSLFQSPSATAKAFMATGELKCLAYLQSLAQRCPNGGLRDIFSILMAFCLNTENERHGRKSWII